MLARRSSLSRLLTRLLAVPATAAAVVLSAVVLAVPAQATSHSVSLSCTNAGGQDSISVQAGDSVTVSSGNCTGWVAFISDSPTGTWTSSDIGSGPSVVFPATFTVDAVPVLTTFTIRFAGPGAAYRDLQVQVTQPLGAPTALSGVIGNGQVDLWWTTPSGGTGTLTDYEVQFSSDSGQSWTSAGTVGSGAPPTSSAPFTITGLANGSNYIFQVRAQDTSNSWGPWSTSSGTLTPSLPPPAPTNVQVTEGNAQVGLTWSAPNTTGYASVTGYQIERNDGSGWSTLVSDTGSTTASYTDSSASNGTSYTYRVAAINDAGVGSASVDSAPAVPFTVPGAPQNIAATTPTDEQLDVTWQAPSANGRAVDGYSVEIAPEVINFMNMPDPNNPNNMIQMPMPGPGTYAAPTNGSCLTASSSTTTGCTIAGLTAGDKYYVRVKAHNQAGYGFPAANFMAFTAVGTPAAPTGVVGLAGDQQVALTWSAGATGGSAITGYLVEMNDGTGWSTVVADTGSTSGSYAATGLVNGTGYTFRVSAINARGTGSASSPSLVSTPSTIPDVPTNVVASRGDMSAGLTWSLASNGGSAITGYMVEANDGSGWVTATSDTGNDTAAYTVTGLTNGSTYSFRVTAMNANGSSAASSSSNSVTPAAVPGQPSGVQLTQGVHSLDVVWAAPTGPSGLGVIGFMIEINDGSGWRTLVADTGSTATSYTATGLSSTDTYTFRVSAINGVGVGLASAASSGMIPLAYSASANLTSVSLGGGVTFSTDAPGTKLAAFFVDGVYWHSGPVSATPNPFGWCFFGGATDKVGTYRVYDESGSGARTPSWSDPYDASVDVTFVGNPLADCSAGGGGVLGTAPGQVGAPTGVVGNGQVALVWGAPGTSGGLPITGYLVEYNDGTGWVTAIADTGSATRTYTVTGLTNGVNYTFRVTAINAAGAGAPSTASSAITPSAGGGAQAPNRPARPSVVAGRSSATVTVRAASTGVIPTSITVTASPGGATCTVSGSSGTCTLVGLTAGTTYTLTAAASRGAAQSSVSLPVTVVPLAGAPAYTITISAVRNGKYATIRGTVSPRSGSAPLTVMVKRAGEAAFSLGFSRPVNSDGSFDWHRRIRIGRVLTVYVTDGVVRSNVLRIEP